MLTVLKNDLYVTQFMQLIPAGDATLMFFFHENMNSEWEILSFTVDKACYIARGSEWEVVNLTFFKGDLEIS